jgi:hypothetical protein
MRNDLEMTNKPPTCYWFVNQFKKFLISLILFSSGGDRDLSKTEVQCCLCLRFCHHDCISVITGYIFVSLNQINFYLFVLPRPMLPFMTNYHFLCKDCSPNKPEEQFTKKTASMF